MRPSVSVICYDNNAYSTRFSARLTSGNAQVQTGALDELINELTMALVLLPGDVGHTSSGEPVFQTGPELRRYRAQRASSDVKSVARDLSVMMTTALRIHLSMAAPRVLVVLGQLDSGTLGSLLYSLGTSVGFKTVPDLAAARAELAADGPNEYDLVVAYDDAPPAQHTPAVQLVLDITSRNIYRGPVIITSPGVPGRDGQLHGFVTCNPAALTAEITTFIRPLVLQANDYPF
jgi:hypothetical protein